MRSMIGKLREKLCSYGVPKRALTAFESQVKKAVGAVFQRKLDAAEDRLLELMDQSSIWRLKYCREKERAEELERLVEAKDKEVEERDKKILEQSSFIAWLRKQVFDGDSERHPKSPEEKTAGPEADSSGSQSTAKDKAGKRKPGKQPGTPGHGRKKDIGTDNERVNHDIADRDKVCPCGGECELTDLPPVTSTETDYQEKVVVREHVRRKVIRRCKKCGRFRGIKKAPKPPKLILRSKYSTNFWRAVIEEKYWLQRPLNRLRVKLKTLNCQVRLGTLINGLKLLHKADIFQAVYEELLDRSRLAEQRHMDETGWKVFQETEDKQSSRWYMWVSKSVDVTVFILDPSKSNEVIQAHLNGVTEGIIICDRGTLSN